MKHQIFVPLLCLIFSTVAQAFDVKVMANNKESISRQLTSSSRSSAMNWAGRHQLKEDELKMKALIVLQKTMTEFTKRNTWCDLGLPTLFIKHATDERVISSPAEYYAFIAYLREHQMIDDIFYKLMKDSADVKNDMDSFVLAQIPPRPFNVNNSRNAGVDLPKLYSAYQGSWPDDVQFCSIGRYFNLVSQLKWKNAKDLDHQLVRLNWLAVKDGHISLEAFNRLEVLRKSDVINWPATIDGYLDIVMKSKDKLAKKIETDPKPNFTETYVARKETLTRRGRLYKNFDSTQVMVLAQIIEKTAKRMDARYAAIHFRYNDPKGPDDEIYVLSPMEQYRASVRLLRKELGEIMRSESFKGTGVEYEDLIAAAFETGLLKSDELEYILKFEDFWNKKTPRWKAYANFAFSIAGSATFYLPPPWNILGAMALVLTQSKVMGQPEPDSEDNWNVII